MQYLFQRLSPYCDAHSTLNKYLLIKEEKQGGCQPHGRRSFLMYLVAGVNYMDVMKDWTIDLYFLLTGKRSILGLREGFPWGAFVFNP